MQSRRMRKAIKSRKKLPSSCYLGILLVWQSGQLKCKLVTNNFAKTEHAPDEHRGVLAAPAWPVTKSVGPSKSSC